LIVEIFIKPWLQLDSILHQRPLWNNKPNEM